MNSSTNKVVIVTGASSSIGFATTKIFAKQGTKVVIAARQKHVLDALNINGCK